MKPILSRCQKERRQGQTNMRIGSNIRGSKVLCTLSGLLPSWQKVIKTFIYLNNCITVSQPESPESFSKKFSKKCSSERCPKKSSKKYSEKPRQGTQNFAPPYIGSDSHVCLTLPSLRVSQARKSLNPSQQSFQKSAQANVAQKSILKSPDKVHKTLLPLILDPILMFV